MSLFVSGQNTLGSFETKTSHVHLIADPTELRLNKGQWYVKTHELVTPLTKCGKTRLLAKLFFITLFSLGFCWLAESVKRDASFYKAGRKVVPIYSPLESLPNKAEPKPADKQEQENNLYDDRPVLEDADFEDKAQPDQLNKIPPPNKVELAELNLEGCQNINDNGLAYWQNLEKLFLPNADRPLIGDFKKLKELTQPGAAYDVELHQPGLTADVDKAFFPAHYGFADLNIKKLN